MTRAIVANTGTAYLLRVYDDFEEDCAIVAWRIEYEPPEPADRHNEAGLTWVFPIAVEEEASNCVQFIVTDGQYVDPNFASHATRELAVAAAREELRGRQAARR